MSISIEKSLDAIAEALSGSTTVGNGSIEYSLEQIATTLGAKTSDVLYVTFEYKNSAWSADATVAEVKAAVTAKKLVVGYDKTNAEFYQLDAVASTTVAFTRSVVAENVLTLKTLTIGAESVTQTTATVTGATG